MERKQLQQFELPVKNTPWGRPDYGYEYAEGITFINTPGHGGFHLSRKRLKEMPDHLRAVGNGSFFEEDCDWSAVAIAFPDAFEMKDAVAASETLRNWHPAVFEKQFGVTLTDGQSYIRDRETFAARSADKFVPKAAWGDWEETTPKGFVKVYAKRASDGAEKYFLIASDLYNSEMICDGHLETTPPASGQKTKCVN